MPQLCFGTFGNKINNALEAGYRHFDGAELYFSLINSVFVIFFLLLILSVNVKHFSLLNYNLFY